MRRLRVAVVGAGVMGKRYANIYAALPADQTAIDRRGSRAS